MAPGEITEQEDWKLASASSMGNDVLVYCRCEL